MKKFFTIILFLFTIAGFVAGYFIVKNPEDKKDFNQATYYEKKYFDDFFRDFACQNNYSKNLGGMIVNHHLLAGKFIAQTICLAATSKKINVVILAPNHFAHGTDYLIATDRDWLTPYGVLFANEIIIQQLADNNIASIDHTPFVYEHGIYNILPFVKKAMPGATIIPIIVHDRITEENKEKLIKFLTTELPENSIIIGSLDFSHNLTSDEADKSDALSLSVINNFSFEKFNELNPNNQPDHVDSKPALEIMSRTMTEKNFRFKLVANSNSAKLIGDPMLKEITSYIVGIFVK